MGNLEKAQDYLPDRFTSRPAAFKDLPEVTEMINRCALAMIGKPETNVSEIKTEWETPGFDLNKSTRLVCAPNGQIAGLSEVWDITEPPVQPWVWGRVHPAFQGLGIGTALLSWAEARTHQAVPRVQRDLQITMRCGTLNQNEAAKQLFIDRGMTLARHFWRMTIELDQPLNQPAWPENIRLVTFADHPDLKAVFQAVEDSFQDHWGFVAGNEADEMERWQHRIENEDGYDPTLWFLAMDGDEIAGLSLCRRHTVEDRQMGFVDELGVRRPWRRQGLALALLHHSFQAFQNRGQKRVGLGVDAASLTGATKLYEKAGMKVTRQFDTYEKVIRPGTDISTRKVIEAG